MADILKNAQAKLAQAQADAKRWQQFIDDYNSLADDESNAELTEIRKDLGINEKPKPKRKQTDRNKIPEKYAHLKIAPMGKCISMTKEIIADFGAIGSTSDLLEYFAQRGYTAKSHSLAAYLSQSEELTYDKANGGWNLSNSNESKDNELFE